MILELGLEVTVPQADRGEKAEADGLCLVPGLIALLAGDVLLGHNQPRPKDVVLRDQHRPSSGFGARLRGAGRFEGESQGEDTARFANYQWKLLGQLFQMLLKLLSAESVDLTEGAVKSQGL